MFNKVNVGNFQATLFRPVYSLYDVKAKKFGPLQMFDSDESAIRSFVILLKSGRDSIICEFPDDFVLYRVGNFDDSTGSIQSEPSPVSIINGFNLVQIVNTTKEVIADGNGEPTTSNIVDIDSVK